MRGKRARRKGERGVVRARVRVKVVVERKRARRGVGKKERGMAIMSSGKREKGRERGMAVRVAMSRRMVEKRARCEGRGQWRWGCCYTGKRKGEEKGPSCKQGKRLCKALSIYAIQLNPHFKRPRAFDRTYILRHLGTSVLAVRYVP